MTETDIENPFGDTDEDNPFNSPGATGVKLPTFQQFLGRLCIFENHPKLEKQQMDFASSRGQKAIPEYVTRLSVDITVLDGEPFTYKQKGLVGVNDPDERVYFDEPIEIPHCFKLFYLSQTVIVKQLQPTKLFAGRVIQLPKISDNQRAFAISDVPGIALEKPGALAELEKRYTPKTPAQTKQMEKAMAEEIAQAKLDFAVAKNFMLERNTFE